MLRTTTTPSVVPTLQTLPSVVQKRVLAGVDLAGLAACARVSRAWLRSVRENSLLPSLHQLRLWPTVSLRKLAVHLTWQSIVQAPPLAPPPASTPPTGAAAPLLILDGLAAWTAHDNEHEAGLQLLQHVRQLVSVGGDGNVEWSTPATQPQREWLHSVSLLPAAKSSVLRFSSFPTTTPRQTHVRISFSLTHMPNYRFFLEMHFERTQRTSSLIVTCQRQEQANSSTTMDVLVRSDVSGLHVMRGAPVGYDPTRSMYVIRRPSGGATGQVATTTPAEQIIDKAFLNGLYLLASFIYAPAATQLKQQIDSLE